MKWCYWIELYTRTHCTARGLRPKTIAAYAATLRQFHAYVRVVLEDKAPDAMTARDVLEYVQHLRDVRGNGDSAVNRTVTILKNFYRAMVAMGYLDASANPMAAFPAVKAARRKMPITYTAEEIDRLLSLPPVPCWACAIVRCWRCCTAPASVPPSVPRFAKATWISTPARSLSPARAVTNAACRSTNASRPRWRSIGSIAARRCPGRRSSAAAVATVCHAAPSTNACGPGAIGQRSPAESRHTDCDTHLPPTSSVPASTW